VSPISYKRKQPETPGRGGGGKKLKIDVDLEREWSKVREEKKKKVLSKRLVRTRRLTGKTN